MTPIPNMGEINHKAEGGIFTAFTEKETYGLMFQSFPDVLTVPQLSRMLNINEKTAYRLVREKQIGHFKVGRTYRIPKVAVFSYLAMVTDEADSYPCQFQPGMIPYVCQ